MAQPETNQILWHTGAPKVNLAWWESLEQVYERERVVWRRFVGAQPNIEDNKLYARFRAMLLKGTSLKANA